MTFETPGTQSLTATDTSTSTITSTASGLAVQAGVGLAAQSGRNHHHVRQSGGQLGERAGRRRSPPRSRPPQPASPIQPTGRSPSTRAPPLLGTVTLSGSDQATFTTGPLSVGTYAFFAVYNGDDATYMPSASPVVRSGRQPLRDQSCAVGLEPRFERRPAIDVHGDGHAWSASSASPRPRPRHRHVLRRHDGAGHRGLEQPRTRRRSRPPRWCRAPTRSRPCTTETVLPRRTSRRPSPRQWHATSQSVVYVNSAWAGDANGTQVTVGGTTLHDGHQCLCHDPGRDRRRGRRGDRQRHGRDLFRAGHDRRVADPRRRGGFLDHLTSRRAPPAAARSRSSADRRLGHHLGPDDCRLVRC